MEDIPHAGNPVPLGQHWYLTAREDGRIFHTLVWKDFPYIIGKWKVEGFSIHQCEYMNLLLFQKYQLHFLKKKKKKSNWKK